MAIAIISDIHGNDEALKAILKDIKKRRIKQVYFLGDAISYGPSSSECLNILEQHKIKCCVGNHEQRMLYYDSEITSPNWSLNGRRHMQFIFRSLTNNNIRFIKSMPLDYKTEYKGFKILFTHYAHNLNKQVEEDYEEFTENNITRMFDKYNCDIVFFGHIHHSGRTGAGRKVLITDKGKAYVCTGSSGCVQTEQTYYTIFDITMKNYAIYKIYVNYNKAALEEKMKKLSDPAETMFAKHFGIKLR